MPNLENLKKQAKLLVRWHRDGNYSVGGRIRGLPRYRNLTDVEALALKFPLSEAQEIIAAEHGYPSWTALKAALAGQAAQPGPQSPQPGTEVPLLKSAMPVLFVSDVQASAAFFRDKLGFTIDFLHGHPPFYGAVSRGSACIHLRFVHQPVLAAGLREQEGLLSAFISVDHIKSLYREYKGRNVAFQHELRKEPWGGPAFTVVDPDGNWICFAG